MNPQQIAFWVKKRLSPHERLVYLLLKTHAKRSVCCSVTRKQLEKESGLSQRSLVDICRTLSKKKLISYKRQGFGRPNLYWLS